MPCKILQGAGLGKSSLILPDVIAWVRFVRAPFTGATCIMANDPGTSNKPRHVAQWAARWWGLAGMIGMTVAVTYIMIDPLPKLQPTMNALIAIVCGWGVMLIFAPWRHMNTLSDKRKTIMQLTNRLRRVNDNRWNDRLKDIILDRDDELGTLSRAIHDTLARSIADRRESRMLHRTMDDTIRRETDRATVRLQRQATSDPLTGLGNRRELEQKLAEYFAPDRRRQRDAIVVMLIDIDLFKPVNDELGHEVGDECLLFLGELLSSTLRLEDSPVRYGGDEFIVLMPNLTISQARAVAERIRSLFAQMPWPHRQVSRPTLSVGLASAWCGDPNGGEELLRRADDALYRSKNSGRNTVMDYEDHRTVA